MEQNYMEIANSFPMWVAAGVAVALAFFQAVLFGKKSYETGKAIGLSEQRMKAAMKSSFITSIGPSLVVLTGLLSLLVTIGGPLSWMRLSFIGSVMFELMAASFGAEAVGVTMGVDPMTNEAFAAAVWTMALGSIGWIVVSTLFTDKMDGMQKKLSNGDPNLLKVISVAAMLGSFGSLSAGHILRFNKNTIACIAGGVIMYFVITISESKNIKWLKEWALAIALFGGMIVAALWPMA